MKAQSNNTIVLKMIILAYEEFDHLPNDDELNTLIAHATQYGKRANVTKDDVKRVLGMKLQDIFFKGK